MRIAFLWHFHQPPYKDPETRRYIFPWVLFHSLKNYHQMIRLHEEAGFPATFNFVPSLIEQIADYAAGNADDPAEKALACTPELLTEEATDILRKLAGRMTPTASRASVQEAALRNLFPPLEGYQDLDRGALLELKKTILEGLLPSYAGPAAAGRIELFTSPRNHPLLPILCDMASAGREAVPGLEFSWPEDAAAQLEQGVAVFKRAFGSVPAGIWPPEGAVSQRAAGLMAEAGFRYAVTDENVLYGSLGACSGPRDILRPYSCRGLKTFFRDRALSDLIGFTYGSWPASDAVSHFLARVGERAVDAPENAVLVVALDGENAWGSYPRNGIPFLRELFARLLAPGSPARPVLFSEAASSGPAAADIDLAPGTWMGGFAKWLGHPEKNRTWEKLARARRLCGPSEEMYAAEASDWFWWAGEPGEEAFNGLFQAFLRAAYRKAGREDERI